MYVSGDQRPGTAPGKPAILGADHPARRPGPASYDVRHNKDARIQIAPAYSFSKSTRNGINPGGAVLPAGEVSPGPADYTHDATFLSAKLAL